MSYKNECGNVVGNNTLNLLGQSMMSQASDSTETPRHARPSPSGAGLLHRRDLVFVKPLDVIEQVDQSDQSFQPPLTLAERQKGASSNKINCLQCISII